MKLPCRPWFNCTIPSPRAWPPPAAFDLAATLRDIRTRDRYGHTIHLVAALLFAFLAPLDHGPNSVSSAILLGVFITRALVHPALFTPLLLWPPFWLALAWVGWMGLSASWSTAEHPARLVGGQRLLLGVMSLFPMLEYSRAIAWALIASASTNASVQIAQKFGVMPLPDGDSWRPSGIVALPAVAAMNAGSAILLTLALWTKERLAGRVVATLTLALCATGMALAASRQPVLALVPALALLAFLLVRWGHSSWRTVASGFVALFLLSALAIPLVGEGLLRYLASAQSETAAALRGEVGFSSLHLRLFWWKLAIEQWLTHPWIGGGVGSFTDFVAAHPQTSVFLSESGISREEVLQIHPHSTFVRALAETGLVGIGLLGALLMTVLRAGWRNAAQGGVVVAGACASFCYFLMTTTTECVELMNIAYAHLVVIIALCAVPRATTRV